MAYANIGPLTPIDFEPDQHCFEVESDLPLGKVLIGLKGVRLVAANTSHSSKQLVVIRAHVPEAAYKAASRAINEAVRTEQLLVNVPLAGYTPPEGL